MYRVIYDERRRLQGGRGEWYVRESVLHAAFIFFVCTMHREKCVPNTRTCANKFVLNERSTAIIFNFFFFKCGRGLELTIEFCARAIVRRNVCTTHRNACLQIRVHFVVNERILCVTSYRFYFIIFLFFCSSEHRPTPRDGNEFSYASKVSVLLLRIIIIISSEFVLEKSQIFDRLRDPEGRIQNIAPRPEKFYFRYFIYP